MGGLVSWISRAMVSEVWARMGEPSPTTSSHQIYSFSGLELLEHPEMSTDFVSSSVATKKIQLKEERSKSSWEFCSSTLMI